MAVLGTIVASGTVLVPRLFARIFHRVSMEWGVKEKPCGCDCPSQFGKCHFQISNS